MATLLRVKDRLLELDTANVDVRCGLRIAQEIKGLGPPGASGLLALMYPRQFGTVDQFVVKALRDVIGLPEATAIAHMKPLSLTIPNGELLIRVMQRKAAELNGLFETEEWTPRQTDMILWTSGRC